MNMPCDEVIGPPRYMAFETTGGYRQRWASDGLPVLNNCQDLLHTISNSFKVTVHTFFEYITYLHPKFRLYCQKLTLVTILQY